MFGLGMSEIIFLGVLALIVIGPKELPELARTLGRFMNDLKRSTNSFSDEIKQQTGFDKLNNLNYFEERKKLDPNYVTLEPEEVGATEAEEDLYPLHNKVTAADPEQMELAAQDETDTTKDPKQS